MDERTLLRALSDPRAYGSAPVSVDVIQTHGAMLFLTGDRVYKVKKPVNLGFLDFSTPDKRRHACEEEVRLNRRFAPGVYLGVVDITRDESGRIRVGGQGEVLECAVEMVRLPADRMLTSLLDRGEATPTIIRRVSAAIAEFHAGCGRSDDIAAFGRPHAVRRRLLRNLEECRRFVGAHREGGAVTQLQLNRLVGWLGRALEDRSPLLQERVEEDRIVEGHGDLHAGNICVFDDRIVAYDCIEFERSFRCADVAAEIAFLAMDLDVRGRRDLSSLLTEDYAVRTGDDHLRELLPLYKCHYAAVRGKVDAMKSREEEVEARDRERARRSAVRCFQHAVGYTLPPCAVLTCGLPGTGKSTAARALAAPLGAVVLRSDEIRKELAGVSITDHDPANAPLLYAPDMTRRTYDEMTRRAADVLGGGSPVILDAMFPSASLRRAAGESLRRAAQAVHVLHVTCNEDEVRRRLADRASKGDDVSDADWRVYERARDSFEAPTPAEGATVSEAPARDSVESVVSDALDAIVGAVEQSPA